MTSSLRFATVLVMLLSASALAACDDNNNPASPSGNTPGISNVTDDFQFNLPNVTSYSTNGGYTWKNTGTTARVTQSSSLSAGSGTLQIRDAGGRIVYARGLSEGGAATTESGPAGDWRIDVLPVNVSGTINFRVQKN